MVTPRTPLTGHETLIEVVERLLRAYAEDKTSAAHFDMEASVGSQRVAVHFVVVARKINEEGDKPRNTPLPPL